jgi:osmoprotectant transport system ATP-binding protein
MLLGPSGSGKTTTLKLINALLRVTEGRVAVEGRSVVDWEITRLRRHIGYAIQDVGLFPHYTVEKNVALVPRLERWDETRVRQRVKEVLHSSQDAILTSFPEDNGSVWGLRGHWRPIRPFC